MNKKKNDEMRLKMLGTFDIVSETANNKKAEKIGESVKCSIEKSTS